MCIADFFFFFFFFFFYFSECTVNIKRNLKHFLLFLRNSRRKYFRHSFLIIIIPRKEKKNGLAGGTPETHMLRKQVVVEYLNVIVRQTTPINHKISIRKLFFYLSSTFASFLSHTSNLVHSSLHLSTWSPMFTSRKPVFVFSVSCQPN